MLQRLVRLQSRQFIAHYSLANAFRLGMTPHDASQAYEHAIRLKPDFAGAHLGLGAVHRELERERLAADCF